MPDGFHVQATTPLDELGLCAFEREISGRLRKTSARPNAPANLRSKPKSPQEPKPGRFVVTLTPLSASRPSFFTCWNTAFSRRIVGCNERNAATVTTSLETQTPIPVPVMNSLKSLATVLLLAAAATAVDDNNGTRPTAPSMFRPAGGEVSCSVVPSCGLPIVGQHLNLRSLFVLARSLFCCCSFCC